MSLFNKPQLEQLLRLKKLDPKTIDLCINGVRRTCNHFSDDIHDLHEMTRKEFGADFADDGLTGRFQGTGGKSLPAS